MFSLHNILILASKPITAARVIKALINRALRPSSRRNNFSETEYTRIATKSKRKRKFNLNIWIKGKAKTVSSEEWTQEHEPRKFREIAKLIAQSTAGGGAKLRILELGVGQGLTLNRLRKYVSDLGLEVEWFGCDLTFARLNNFNKDPAHPVELANANGCHLPYPNGFFNLVYTHHVLEQIPRDFGDVILEALRVGKRFMAMEPCFEHAELDGKVNMIIKDHVIGLKKFFANNTNEFEIITPQISQKATNPTMYFLCNGLTSVDRVYDAKNPYICPVSHEQLRTTDNMLVNKEGTFGYPIVCNIPILKPSFRFNLTKTSLQAEEVTDFPNYD